MDIKLYLLLIINYKYRFEFKLATGTFRREFINLKNEKAMALNPSAANETKLAKAAPKKTT